VTPQQFGATQDITSGVMVQVVTVSEGACQIQYNGPPSIANGVVAAIKAQFPDIKNVVMVN